MVLLTWDYNGQGAVIRAFQRLGYEVLRQAIDQSGNIVDDPDFCRCLKAILMESRKCGSPCRFVFSHDYFPAASQVCQQCGVPYVSVVYDSPHYSLTSPTLDNAVNRIYVFDRGLIEELESLGITNLQHILLSVDPDMAVRTARLDALPYEHDVSFVGSLYRGSDIFYDQITGLPSALRAYFDLAIDAQRRIFGLDLLGDPETVPDKMIDAMQQYVKFSLTDDYRMEPRSLLRDILRKKVTSVERSDILSRLGERFDVDLYTTPGTDAPPGVRNRGYAEREFKMPGIFNRTKVNINITLRTIRTGIPQRAMDVMACGGFLLSDYREELAEYFAEGEELALARTPEDFVALAEYYLSHEEERERIARNGQRKVLEYYTHDRVFSTIFAEIRDLSVNQNTPNTSSRI